MWDGTKRGMQELRLSRLFLFFSSIDAGVTLSSSGVQGQQLARFTQTDLARLASMMGAKVVDQFQPNSVTHLLCTKGKLPPPPPAPPPPSDSLAPPPHHHHHLPFLHTVLAIYVCLGTCRLEERERYACVCRYTLV